MCVLLNKVYLFAPCQGHTHDFISHFVVVFVIAYLALSYMQHLQSWNSSAYTA